MYQQNIQHITGSPAGSGDLFTDPFIQHKDSEITESSKKHSEKINKIIEELYKATFISRRGQRDPVRTGRRKNKNEILALTLARLLKNKHLRGTNYSREMELVRDIQTNSNNTEFILVIRTDGRIIAISDEAEQHLEKSMRSLYTQCLNIFECFDQTDSDKLHSILSSSTDSTRQEYRLVCTLRLPKGKRPSRVREDIKTITMTGHFYSCHDLSSSTPNERLFIARCEALISATASRSSSSQTTTMTYNNNNGNSIIKLILNEDMTIQTISPNAQNILGYSNNDLSGSWFGRYLTAKDVQKFEAIRQKYFQHEPEEQQKPISICDIFDIYTYNGDGRLTFLYQIRSIRERRKPIKFAVVAQLIDPSLRNEYTKYVQSKRETISKPAKAEQVNLVSSSTSETSEDGIMAHSPTLTNVAQLIFDGTTRYECLHQSQFSPFSDKLSNAVAPINIDDQSWNELFDINYSQYSTRTDIHYWPSSSIDDAFFDYQSAEELENFIKECING